MTEVEAKNRADRIVSLDLPKEQLAKEIARELRLVAEECGWQKEKLQDLEFGINELKKNLGKP